MTKIHIRSFGCQMNKLDTALITAALKKADFTLTEHLKEADDSIKDPLAADKATGLFFNEQHIVEYLITNCNRCLAEGLGEPSEPGLDEQVHEVDDLDLYAPQ